MTILAQFPIPVRCPYCGSEKFHKHGSRKRHVIERVKTWYQVQRFRCTHCCEHRTFTVLLPNMLPHKHYAAPEIEQVLQNQEDPTSSPHECGAEESTLRRWAREFPSKLSAFAALLELLANVSVTRLLAPLQRVYNALGLLVRPPANQCRLAWAFFVNKYHPVCV